MALSIQAVRAGFETLRSLAFGSISGTYAAVGSALANPARIVHVYNGTDADMFFSIDGTNNHFIVPSGGFILFDFTTNKSIDPGLFISQGTIFYVKQVTAPTSGSVYVAVVYGVAPQP